LSKIFSILFNVILKYEEIPKDMKICSVTQVHKPKDVNKPNKPKDDIKSYRPVFKNFMKLFETLILNMNSFIASNNIIPHTVWIPFWNQ
jgi:hypothetical protein